MESSPLPKYKPIPPKRTRPKFAAPVTQVKQLQAIVFKQGLEEGLNPRDRAGLARAWCDLNEEARKLSMKPLPRSIDVSKLAKRGRRQAPQAPAEPAEPGPVSPPIPQE
jgi:hypothetical protein